jgi:hypothetical protein
MANGYGRLILADGDYYEGYWRDVKKKKKKKKFINRKYFKNQFIVEIFKDISN